MINTVTLNPSLDYVVKVENFVTNGVNRSQWEEICPGGKGLNVSMVLHNLGFKSKAFGYIAGFTGEEIKKRMMDSGCDCDFIKMNEGMSRINIKLKSTQETEINGQGPGIGPEEIKKLHEKLEGLNDGDVLVLAGTIPSTLPENTYEMIMERLQGKNIKIIVDATKESLLNVLKYKPFLIKPNHHELAEIFNVELENENDIVFHARKLQEMGAENVIISMAGQGAIFIKEDGTMIKRKAPKGVVKNSVGAGDSMVAGFIAGYLQNNNLEEAFKMGVATGSATAFSEGLATKEKVEELLKQL